MAQVRMDIEQVRQFGNDLKGRFVTELQQLKSTIQTQSNGLNWEGPDAQQFKGDKTAAVAQAIDQLVGRLDDLGMVALNNAANQETISNQV